MSIEVQELVCHGGCKLKDPRVRTWGVLLIEIPVEDDDPQYFADAPRLPQGPRFRSYHLSCFTKVMDEFQRQEQRTVATLAIGHVSDLMEFFYTVEEDDDSSSQLD